MRRKIDNARIPTIFLVVTGILIPPIVLYLIGFEGVYKWVSFYILIPLAAFFGVLGWIFLRIGLKSASDTSYLYNTGRLLMGKGTRIMRSSTFTFGAKPYRLIVVVEEDGQEYYFESDDIYKKYDEVFEYCDLPAIPVFVNGDDYSEYFVDLSIKD